MPFDREVLAVIRRLQNARLSLLQKQPFYALLLMHMKFSLDLSAETAYTDGERIAFNPDFMDRLSDKELEFVLMHEVLHAALGHPFRCQADYDPEAYDIACDIVVNSNILFSFGMDKRRITLKEFGEAMHLTPDGQEGHLFSVEQVYGMVLKALKQPPEKKRAKGQGKGGASGAPGAGGNAKDVGDDDTDAGGTEDTEKAGDGGKKNPGKGDKEGDENHEPTQADIDKLVASLLRRGEKDAGSGSVSGLKKSTPAKDAPPMEAAKETQFDDHTFWEGDDEMNSQKDVWLRRMVEATDVISSMGGGGCGATPLAAERLVDALKKPIIDWRTILHDFIQEEICDYSFAPPDKRMEDSPFFLPDFNEKEERVKNILFMIDTSGSMSDDAVTQCYSEILGAIGQFNGKLAGLLGFFDAVVVEPIPFEDEEEFKIIRPKGGGGTSFQIIFDYVREKMQEEPPASIVILTDGGAPFPEEAEADGIPVLWIIDNDRITPPWGKVARLME